MKIIINLLASLNIVLLSFSFSLGNIPNTPVTQDDPSTRIQEISQQKWNWILERKIDSLDFLIHPDFVFHEPQIRMDKTAYLGVVSNGNRAFKQIEILDVDVQIIDDLIILKTNVDFTLATDTDPIQKKSVIEVYKKYQEDWKLIQLQIDPMQ